MMMINSVLCLTTMWVHQWAQTNILQACPKLILFMFAHNWKARLVLFRTSDELHLYDN